MSRREVLTDSQKKKKAAERETRARKREAGRLKVLELKRLDLTDALGPGQREGPSDSEFVSDSEEEMADAPPPFHGLHTEDAETWWRSADWWLQTKRAADDRARIAFVAGLLRDSARTWFHSLTFAAVDAPAEEPNLRTFGDFRQAFQMRYRRDKTNGWREQAALWTMAQGPAQSVESFISVGH